MFSTGVAHADPATAADGIQQVNKAQVEHGELLLQQLIARRAVDDAAATPDQFPWTAATLSALGLAFAATGGVIVLRRRRSVPQMAAAVADDEADAGRDHPAHVGG